ncbi:MAG: molybdopterin molybdotransferase MoeA [Planctomycetes bacterium]|nr:molybdopterin molybdotransferase MoeA [Planctomycetota bacterium]
MLTVPEALESIIRHSSRLEPMRVPLAEGLGLVLARDAISDLDSPPFDKALMDGYALRSADVREGAARLRVVDEVLAGQTSRRTIQSGDAIRIMTGAPIPAGADAVVQVERTQLETTGTQQIVTITNAGQVPPGRNIMKRAESLSAGTCVVPAGRRLRAQEIGALAELGQSRISVIRAPRVAILATGDELVPIDEVPGPGQIRNSNEMMLAAQVRQMGAHPVMLGVARDKPDELLARIRQGLEYDVLLLSGGVSAGKLDLVPAALEAAGVQQVFHKVQVKPGQPLWFGTNRIESVERSHSLGEMRCYVNTGGMESEESGPCRVFGLPGNPVSSMVCCELFVGTLIRRLMGIEPAIPQTFRGSLTREHFHGGNRPTYHPARWEWTDYGGRVEPVTWKGSADLSATVAANALAIFTEPDRLYPADSVIDVLVW